MLLRFRTSHDVRSTTDDDEDDTVRAVEGSAAANALAEVESNASGDEQEDVDESVMTTQNTLARRLMLADGKSNVMHKRMKIEEYDMTNGSVSLALRPGYTNAHILVVYTK